MTRSSAGPLPIALLAAGEGRRLRGTDIGRPKPLTPLADRTIGGWSLSSLAAAGATELLVVVGWQTEATRAHYSELANDVGVEIGFAEAPQWKKGNGVSALAAAAHFGERPFVLAMADHLFSTAFLEDALSIAPRPGEVILVIDREPAPTIDLDDLTKVRTRGNRIVEIGKDLEDWDAGDTGFFVCTSVLGEVLDAAQQDGEFALTDGVRRLARTGRLRSRETTHAWMDIDTPEDLAAAEQAGSPVRSRSKATVHEPV